MGGIGRHARRSSPRPDAGFTLVELLILVVVLGVLAALAVPIYLGIQVSARNAATQNWMAETMTKLALYTSANGSYAPTLADAGVVPPPTITADYYASGSAFCVSAYHVESDAKGNVLGPLGDTWKTVVIPSQGRTSFTPVNPASYCVNSAG